jgi:hypothetical protein
VTFIRLIKLHSRVLLLQLAQSRKQRRNDDGVFTVVATVTSNEKIRQVECLSLHSIGQLNRGTSMHKFTIVKQSGSPAVNEGLGVLNPQLLEYLAGELDLVALSPVLGGINKQYLALRHLSLNPIVGLFRLGCENTSELEAATAYPCGFLGGMTRHCLVPLGVLVESGLTGLHKYRDVFDNHAKDGCDSTFLHLVPDSERFQEHVLAPFGPEHPQLLQFEVDRFEQLYLGSGYTRDMLVADNSVMTLRPVGLKLSNGDTLVCYAYQEAAGSVYGT